MDDLTQSVKIVSEALIVAADKLSSPDYVTLAAVVVSPLAGFGIAWITAKKAHETAKMQSLASIRSSSRQKWIDKFRENIVEIVSLGNRFTAIAALQSRKPEELIKIIGRIIEVRTEIILMTNNEELDVQRLEKAMKVYTKLGSRIERSARQGNLVLRNARGVTWKARNFGKAREGIQFYARSIIRQEWAKIKSGL